LLTEKSELEKLMHIGATKAQEIAQKTLTSVYEKVGFAK